MGLKRKSKLPRSVRVDRLNPLPEAEVHQCQEPVAPCVPSLLDTDA